MKKLLMVLFCAITSYCLAGNAENDVCKSDSFIVRFAREGNRTLLMTLTLDEDQYPIIEFVNKRNKSLEIYPENEHMIDSNTFSYRYVLFDEEREFISNGDIVSINISNDEQTFMVPLKRNTNSILKKLFATY